MSTNVEDIHEVTPLQHGMLMHSLLAPTAGAYVNQLVSELLGAVDLARLERAFNATLRRHGVLRSSFVFEGLEKPVQVIHRELTVPLAEMDLRGVGPDEQARQLEALLASDRRTGFELARAPLMRLRLVRLDERRSQLIWTHHHVLLDGWSVALVVRDLFESYAALASAIPQPLPAPPPPFVSFIRQLQAAKPANADFWRDYLGGFSAATPVGHTWLPSKGASEDYSATTHTLDEPSTAALRDTTNRLGVTFQSVVSAAWSLVLARHAGADNVVFGQVVAGRPHSLPDVERMVGLFVNTVPVRVRVDETETVAAFVKRFQAERAALIEHELTPLVDIQSASEVPRGQPLFDSVVDIDNFPSQGALLGAHGDIQIASYRSITKTNFALTLTASPGSAPRFRLIFDGDRIAPSSAETLLAQLLSTLRAWAGEPHSPLGDLSLGHVDAQPTAASEASEPAEARVEQAFFERAAEHPEQVAVIAGADMLRYGELQRRALGLAQALSARGVQPGDVIGMCLPRTADAVVAMLGILRAGAAYLPLDPSYPAQRLAFMLEQARAACIVGDATLLASLGLPTAASVDLTQIAPCEPTELPAVTGADGAYVLFTSGSTGQPKGVLMPHAALLNLLTWQARVSLASRAATTLQFAPFGFDVSFQEVFATLTSGGTLVMLDEQQRRDPFTLWQVLCAQQVERIFLPFVALQQVAEAFAELRTPATRLREVVTAGEALHLTPAIVELFRSHPEARLVNQYGPTETHVVTSFALPLDATTWRGLPPIGQAVDNTVVKILDERSRPCPPGVLGEIWVSGRALSRGYIHAPDATRERFRELPSVGEGKFYRTGDLGRLRGDGDIEFVGRRDHQLKIRGHRVELGEVEAALRAHPCVAAAAVVPHGQGQATRLVAYLVAPADQQPLPTAELRRYLAARLPDPFLPQVYTWVPDLPRTATGKLDRRALPEPKWADEHAPGFAAPANAAEELVAATWRAALGLAQVGRHDNFFELGGHSLLLMQIFGKLKKSYPSAGLTLVELFDHATVKGRADRIAGGQAFDDELSENARRGERRRRTQHARLASSGDNDG